MKSSMFHRHLNSMGIVAGKLVLEILRGWAFRGAWYSSVTNTAGFS